MSTGPHHEGEPHDHDAPLSEAQVRVRALETILVAKGYVDPAALDALIDTYEAFQKNWPLEAANSSRNS